MVYSDKAPSGYQSVFYPFLFRINVLQLVADPTPQLVLD